MASHADGKVPDVALDRGHVQELVLESRFVLLKVILTDCLLFSIGTYYFFVIYCINDMIMHPESLSGLSERDRKMMGMESAEVPRGPRHALALERERIRKNKEAMLVMGDLTADDRGMLEGIDSPIFAPDEAVRVPRSSGEVEGGWNVAIPLNEKGRVVVAKGNVIKAIPEARLAELNPDGPDVQAGSVGVRKTEKRVARNFAEDERVRVKRSSGDIEEGWKVVVINESSGKVLVSKGDKVKSIRKEELEKLNPEPS